MDVHRWLEDRTDSRGADIFFDCVGRNEAVELAVGHTGPGGKVALVGNPFTDMLLERQNYWKILRNQLTVLGTWNSSFRHEEADDWHYCLERLRHGMKPEILISHRLPFDALKDGLEIMRDKKEDYCKIMTIL